MGEIRENANKCGCEIEVCEVGTLTHENELYISEGNTDDLTGEILIMGQHFKVRFQEQKFFHQSTIMMQRTSTHRSSKTYILQCGEIENITRMKESQTTWK